METVKRAFGLECEQMTEQESLKFSQLKSQADYRALLEQEEKYKQARRSQLTTKTPLACTTESEVKLHPSKVMLACQWNGPTNMSVSPRIVRAVTDPEDAIVRVTSTTICGSDLHMYYNLVPGAGAMKEGDILGHECTGVVEEVGANVKQFKAGERVVVSAVISCGNCNFCKSQRPSLCDHTNPSGAMEQLYGHRMAGIFGYTHLTGGYSGCQAEYVRVPLADNQLLKIPDNLSDSNVLLLSDTCCTGWHALELAEVGEGSNVCVWGLGPVGMMATYLALKLKKANKVVAIDCVPYRLNMAASFGVDVINFNEKDVLTEVFNKIPGGPNHCIDAAGFRYSKSFTEKITQKLSVTSTDTSDIISEVVKCCQKGGFISLIGDYFGNADEYPVGAQMEKSLTVRGGQVYVQKYWKYLLSNIEDGTIDPSFQLTHQMDFENIAQAYARFAEKKDDSLKLHLSTEYGREISRQRKGAGAQVEEKITDETSTSVGSSARRT